MSQNYYFKIRSILLNCNRQENMYLVDDFIKNIIITGKMFILEERYRYVT